MLTQYKAKLFESLSKNNLESITENLYDILNCPYNVTDEYYHVKIQEPKIPLDDIIWDSYLRNGFLSPDIIKLLNENHLIEKGIKEIKPHVVHAESIGKYPRIACPIRYEKNHYGYLTVYFVEKEITDFELNVIELTSQAIAMYYSRNNNYASSTQNMFELLLNQLFLNQIKGEEEIKVWTDMLQMETSSKYIIVCAKANDNNIGILQKVNNEMKVHLHYLKSTLFKNGLYLLFDRVRQQSTISLMNQMIDMFKNYNLQIGISNEFSDLLQAHVFQKQSELAASMCTDGQVTYFSHTTLEAMAQKLNENGKLFVHPAFSLLKQFDLENKTEYYKTLISYLLHFGRQNEIEQNLNIHRNTVRNRLVMIENLIECSLDDAYTFAHLYISYIMLNVHDAQ